MNKKWKIYERDEELINKISNKYNISNLVARILINRGITEDDEIEVFLNPTRKNFHNPYLLDDMEKAVNRIIKAIENKENVTIYGDYDVDGITSITVLKKFLDERNLNVDYYIPNRLEEGYGLNKKAIEGIAKKGCNLILTVDCGISCIEEIKYANSLNIETIITDHHEPLEELPEAYAIINPKRKNSKYPFRELAGVGVVFKFIQAIGIKLNLEEKEYLKYLDLVCVGTISDIVPLINENRVIAKLGLKLVEVTRNAGLRELIKVSGYKKIDSSAISFGVAPRINACGRMGHADEALKLFLTNNIVEAVNITKLLDKYNRERQETEKRIVQEAMQKINEEKIENLNSIILGSENWHHGVIGIVASKLTEMYFKPTILLCFEDEIAKGSGRSIPGFDLHDALCKTSKYLEKYGGHSMAVGLSARKENFNELKKAFEKIAIEENIKEIVPVIYIDEQIYQKDISLKTANDLKILEPFGEGNKMPVFACRNLRIDSIRALSEGKHLKMTLKDENQVINAIGFNMGKLTDEFSIGDKVDVVGNLEINNFNGREIVQINLKDIIFSY